jgi:CRP-like cAMP-binding protein
VLIERGHAGSGLYAILEGSVLVEVPERTRELDPGSIVGELALAETNGKRTARVRALTDVRVLALNRIDAEQL